MLVDTGQARKELEQAGFSREQTDAQLNVVRMLDERARERLATKDDLANLEKRISYRILTAVLAILGGVWGLLGLYL